MKLVVFGWGNVSRGDDGLGPLLLARIAEARWADASLIEDFQLQLEHALDLQGADLALFLDAGKNTPAPFAFTEIHARHGMTHTSHALAPEAVLGVYEKTMGGRPPPSFLLCVRGESFDLGEGLSAAGAARLEQSWAFLEALERARGPLEWRARTE
ncbi:hydrogenase maturation protease [Rhodoblastus sp. 17X3]|uniref:hydrogenase maturation protease n=1 Tax=Rhodoblastus sp. 17X3 TaxID=3047026 RepID=UPI0024B7FB4E|nr:hydrogenase maturation protease [Rhodoblastus sp. 17X3]MDI9848690.1 hydrogenase maturation protease [Rhodoblastus sp. 17X3]